MDENALKELKRKRSAAKGAITKIQNNIKELLLDVKNIDNIKDKIPELDAAMEVFEAAHEAYHANLIEECDIEESQEYYQAEMTRVCNIKERIELITAAKKTADSKKADDVLSTKSHSSKASSRSSVKARKAALEVQAAMLKKRQALEEKKMRLQQDLEKLELDTEIASLAAEENAYYEEENKPTLPPIDATDDQNNQQPVKIESSSKIDNDQQPVKIEPGAKDDDDQQRVKIETGSNGKSASVKTEFSGPLADILEAQQKQTNQIEYMLNQQRQSTLALTLPQPEVPTFDGDPLNYCSFVRALESLIETKTTDNSSRLYYLIQYTKGDVQELMRSCLMMDKDHGYEEARKQLKQRYGQDYHIATAYVNKLTEYPQMKAENVEGMRKFSTLLTSCRNTLKELGYSSKIENPDTMRRIVDKLPYGIRLKWREVADAISEKKCREITIDDLASFVEDRARVAAHPIFGNVSGDSNQSPKGKIHTRRAVTFATSSSSDNERSYKEVTCPSCQQNHWLSRCPVFKAMSLDERRKFVRNKSLCDNCLTYGHIATSCSKASFCKVEGCIQKHSTFLHPKANANKDTQKSSANGVSNARIGYVENQPAAPSQRTIALSIVPVNVKAQDGDRIVHTYALLDGGSNVTLCTERLKDALNAEGDNTTLSMTTLEKEGSPKDSTALSLQVSPLDDDTQLLNLPEVFSFSRLPVSTESIANEIDVNRWPHLRDLSLPSIDADVDLLIGSDVPQALLPVEVRGGLDGEPYGVKTALGWSVVGPIKKKSDVPRTSNFISSDDDLNSKFESYCNMEFNDAQYDDKTTMSQQDKQALDIMKNTIQLKEGHYELALPWKNNPPALEDNRSVALNRLLLLKKRLSKDPKLHEKYSTFISNLLEKNHASKVTNNTDPVKVVWYLPHHPVIHPKKPDKVRVVYDCSAKFKGKSLNDELLQGPDLTNSLTGVLTRFREEPIAFMADVESMFYQVRVPEEDRTALRFLWFKDGDINDIIEEYQMNVHLFGGTSSPSCANFALRKTADDNADEFSLEAIETVKRNFYVDDCLKSVPSEEIAVNLSKELRELLLKGGFRLTKWMSNSTKVVSSIPETERAPSTKSLDFENPHIERALGIQWNVSSDTFGFSIAIKDKPATRRGILSTVSSIYDPLGLVAPFTLPAKMILQDLCRKKLGWDDPIPTTELQRWKDWLQDLPHLEKLSIDRCFKPKDFGGVVSAQLHNFSDASQLGYGGATYLRLVNQNGRIHCAFVHGKSRLAPLKSVTIPRLELSAAVLSTKLEDMAQKELTIPLTDRSTFWTDSTCVLAYINNVDRRFHTFVSNRITAIHERSSTIQWQYVDTNSNPADDASRGLPPKTALDANCRWLNGPDFLWRPEDSWPHLPSVKLEDDDPEVKREVSVCATVAKSAEYDVTNLFLHFSDWLQLRKFVAWMLRFKANLRNICHKRRNNEPIAVAPISRISPITVDELNAAEREILKGVQSKAFPDEISTLSASTPTLRRSSSICNLSPQLKDGMLCVGGRLSNAPVDDQIKHQIILPSKSHVSETIIRHYHTRSGHSGTEYVLSQLREKFWVIRARGLVRRIVISCFLCRKHHGKVQQQKMADLPRDRVTPSNPPFTYVGIDFFGPFQVKRGRATVKRYGVIYTCLTVRAVHIEVAHSLDTDSFINSLRRFTARRGPPKEIRTDNGTNFVGGERELREAIQSFNQKSIHEALLQRNIKWTFNPPAGSHHGGVWERCIRSARKILYALLKEQTIHDETLSTLMCEVEMVMNGRPLTAVSDDPRDLEPLTPNHLLLLRSGATPPPGVFAKEDTYSRRRWRQVQYLADTFWKRWVKEYLPTLQSRQKWVDEKRNLQPNDVVLIADESTNRSSWPLARVLEVYKNSNDGLVRSVKVKTNTSTLVRPVSKIILLEEADVAA